MARYIYVDVFNPADDSKMKRTKILKMKYLRTKRTNRVHFHQRLLKWRSQRWIDVSSRQMFTQKSKTSLRVRKYSNTNRLKTPNFLNSLVLNSTKLYFAKQQRGILISSYLTKNKWLIVYNTLIKDVERFSSIIGLRKLCIHDLDQMITDKITKITMTDGAVTTAGHNSVWFKVV